MSAGVFDLAVRLEAHRLDRAVPAAARRHHTIRPHALVLCPLLMAGEADVLHGVSVGPRNRRPLVLAAGDPRIPAEQLDLIVRLGRDAIVPYFRDCRDNDEHPQVIVPSAAAADALEVVVTRLQRLRPREGAKRAEIDRVEEARLTGMLLGYLVERREISGQQALLAATSVLSAYQQTGQDGQADAHLAAAMAWARPPAEGAAVAARDALRRPFGVIGDPRYDDEVLSPLVADYLKSLKTTSKGRKRMSQESVQRAVGEALRPIWDMTLRAVDHVETLGLEPLDGLDTFSEREREAFDYFMKQLKKAVEAGRGVWPHPRFADRSIYRLAEIEDAMECLEAARVWGDPVWRARAVFAGDVLRATVERCDPATGRMTVSSGQRTLRLRRGDQLRVMGESASPKLRVVDLRRDGARTVCELAGPPVEELDLPREGEQADFGSGPPDWSRLMRERGKISRQFKSSPRLGRSDGPVQPLPAVQAPPEPGADPVAVVEALR